MTSTGPDSSGPASQDAPVESIWTTSPESEQPVGDDDATPAEAHENKVADPNLGDVPLDEQLDPSASVTTDD